MIISLIMLSAGCGKSQTTDGPSAVTAEKQKKEKVMFPDDFSLAGTWEGTYEQKKVTLVFLTPQSGKVLFEGSEKEFVFNYTVDTSAKHLWGIEAESVESYDFDKFRVNLTYQDNNTLVQKYSGLALRKGQFSSNLEPTIVRSDDASVTYKRIQ